MALYKYKCPDCDRTLETIRKVEDRDAPIQCECGEEMEREVSESSFQLKGGGWTGRFHS